jgi:hypothetical protein
MGKRTIEERGRSTVIDVFKRYDGCKIDLHRCKIIDDPPNPNLDTPESREKLMLWWRKVNNS